MDLKRTLYLVFVIAIVYAQDIDSGKTEDENVEKTENALNEVKPVRKNGRRYRHKNGKNGEGVCQLEVSCKGASMDGNLPVRLPIKGPRGPPGRPGETGDRGEDGLPGIPGLPDDLEEDYIDEDGNMITDPDEEDDEEYDDYDNDGDESDIWGDEEEIDNDEISNEVLINDDAIPLTTESVEDLIKQLNKISGNGATENKLSNGKNNTNVLKGEIQNPVLMPKGPHSIQLGEHDPTVPEEEHVTTPEKPEDQLKYGASDAEHVKGVQKESKAPNSGIFLQWKISSLITMLFVFLL